MIWNTLSPVYSSFTFSLKNHIVANHENVQPKTQKQKTPFVLCHATIFCCSVFLCAESVFFLLANIFFSSCRPEKENKNTNIKMMIWIRVLFYVISVCSLSFFSFFSFSFSLASFHIISYIHHNFFFLISLHFLFVCFWANRTKQREI